MPKFQIINANQTGQLIAEALLSALAFAHRTGDTGRVRALLELLELIGREKRWAYVKIVRATAPLRLSEAGGRVSVKFQRPRERECDLVEAARLLDFADRPLDGLDCERWTKMEFNIRLKELGFYLARPKPFDLRSITNEADYQSWTHSLRRAHPTELLATFWACAGAIDDPITAPQATMAITALEREWQQRTQASDFFIWPRSFVAQGSGTLDDLDAPDRGIFSALGYRVGKVQGQPAGVRRFILDYIFLRTLPPVNGPLYMQKWAQPKTPRRLQSMAYFLARTSWNAQRRTSQDLRQAISDWTCDLAYLKDRYYTGYFRWP